MMNYQTQMQVMNFLLQKRLIDPVYPPGSLYPPVSISPTIIQIIHSWLTFKCFSDFPSKLQTSTQILNFNCCGLDFNFLLFSNKQLPFTLPKNKYKTKYNKSFKRNAHPKHPNFKANIMPPFYILTGPPLIFSCLSLQLIITNL